MNPIPNELEANRTEREPLGKLVGGTLLREITSGLDRGELAELRRWSPNQPPASPTFWRIVLWHLEPAGWIPEANPSSEQVERRARAERQWAALLAAMVELEDLYARNRRLGEALHAAGVSEARLLRLLRAEGDALFDALRTAVRQLASARESVDWTDLARLILSDGWNDRARDQVRLELARNYYSAQRKSEQTGETR